MSTMTPVPDNTQPLRDLMREVMDREGWSYEDLVANAKRARGKSWFNDRQRERYRKRLLTYEDLQALADGLRQSLSVVRAADLAGHGLQSVAEGEQPWLIWSEVAGLSDTQRAAVRLVIQAMLETHDAPITDETSATDTVRDQLDREAAAKLPTLREVPRTRGNHHT